MEENKGRRNRLMDRKRIKLHERREVNRGIERGNKLDERRQVSREIERRSR